MREKFIVRGEKKGQDIYISIEDNGMGMPEDVLQNLLTDTNKVSKHGSGVGVINVHSRIRLMFGEKYGLSVESEPDEGQESLFIFRQFLIRERMLEQLENNHAGSGGKRMRKNKITFLVMELLLLILALFLYGRSLIRMCRRKGWLLYCRKPGIIDGMH